MSGIAIDPQQTGWEDDNHPSGSLRAKLKRGDLALVPFRHIQYIANGYAQNYGGIPENSDGSMSGIYLSQSPGLGGTCYVALAFHGSVFGIRFIKAANYDAPSVLIDGAAFSLPFAQDTWASQMGVIYRGDRFWIIDENLPDGEHHAEIHLTPDVPGGVTRNLQLTGLILEKRLGYVTPRPRIRPYLTAPVPLTGAEARIDWTTLSPTSSIPQAIRKIWYCNTGGAPSVLTIRQGSAGGTIIYQKSIPANDTLDLDWGDLMAQTEQDPRALWHAVSVATVNFTIWASIW